MELGPLASELIKSRSSYLIRQPSGTLKKGTQWKPTVNFMANLFSGLQDNKA